MVRSLPSAAAAFVLPPAPEELRDLVRIMGAEATLRLVEIHGGTRLPTPKSVTQGTKLAREIGLDAARALSAEYVGVSFVVPLSKPWRAAIYRGRDGLSYSAIARRLQASEKSVAAWLSAARLTAPPLDTGATSSTRRRSVASRKKVS